MRGEDEIALRAAATALALATPLAPARRLDAPAIVVQAGGDRMKVDP